MRSPEFDVVDRDAAIRALGAASRTADPSVVVGAGTVLVFVERGAGSLSSRDHYVWTRVSPPLVENRRLEIRLFAREPDGERYRCLGRRAHLASWGHNGARESMTFSLADPVPRRIAALHGCPPPPRDPLFGPEIVEALAQPRPDRFALVRRFYESWYETLRTAPPQEGTAPTAVREWTALWHAMAELHRSAVACQPISWTREGTVWIFQREEQDVARWAVRQDDLRQDDPPVVMRVSGDWRSSSRCVSEHALQLLLVLAAFGGGAGTSGWTSITPDLLHRVIAGLRSLPLLDWIWPGEPTRLFYTDRAYVCVCERHGEAQLACIAPDDDAFDATLRQLGLEREQMEIHVHT